MVSTTGLVIIIFLLKMHVHRSTFSYTTLKVCSKHILCCGSNSRHPARIPVRQGRCEAMTDMFFHSPEQSGLLPESYWLVMVVEISCFLVRFNLCWARRSSFAHPTPGRSVFMQQLTLTIELEQPMANPLFVIPG